MAALELPARIHVKITGPSTGRKRKRRSVRSGFFAGLLAGAALVLLYLHVAVEPKLQVSSETVQFSPVSVDSSTASKQVIVKNVGGAVLHVGDVEVTGSAAGEYTASSGCTNAVIAEQQSCTIDISLKPSTAGERAADLNIPNDSDDRITTVHLTGAGVVTLGPQVTAEPPSLSFEQPANASVTRELLLHSSGDTPAAIASINVTGDPTFTIVQNCANTALAIGATCPMEVTFVPSQAGSMSGTLEISYAGRNGDQLVRVPLSAVANPVTPQDTPPPPPALQGKLDVTPAEVPFTLRIGQSVKPAQVTVSNVGDGPLPLTRVEIIRGTENFIADNRCANITELPPHATCIVLIAPNSRNAGQFVGSLSISTQHDDREVPLSAMIVQDAVAKAEVKPTTVRMVDADKPGLLAALFSSLANNGVVHISSTGDAPLVIDHLEFSSPNFTVAKGNSGRQCRAGLQVVKSQECLIQVNFRQGAPSTTADLRIFDNAANSPQSVQLIGILQAAKTSGTLQVSGGGDFGNVAVGRAAGVAAMAMSRPTEQVISLQNVGNGNLALSSITLSGNSSFKMFRQCGNELAPKSTCSVVVTFQPIAYGELTASVVIDNDGSTGTQTVSLRGTGINPNTPVRNKIESQKVSKVTIQ